MCRRFVLGTSRVRAGAHIHFSLRHSDFTLGFLAVAPHTAVPKGEHSDHTEKK